MSKPDLPELPAPFEPEWPELHAHALGCGVEDRGIVSRYEAAEYGFQDGVDKAAQCVPEDIYTGDQMTAYAEEAVRQALDQVFNELNSLFMETFEKRIRAHELGRDDEQFNIEVCAQAMGISRSQHVVRGITQALKEQPYWLCCGSTDPYHQAARMPDCFDASRAKWGTKSFHRKDRGHG